MEDPISPSPTTGNLGTFKGGDISGFTGSSDITISIYEIKLKKLSLPIKLRYDNSGVKVGTLASWVGLNWSLDIGGSITRIINGAPDDVRRENSSLTYNMSILSQKEFGFLLGGATAAYNFTDVGKSNAQINARIHAINGTNYQLDDNLNLAPIYKDGTWGQRYDTQPDLFLYNIFGRTGKFVFDTNQQIKLLNDDPYKMDYTLNNSTSSYWSMVTTGITSFSIVDGDGNKYTFSDLEHTEFRSGGRRVRTACDVDPDRHNFFELLNYYSAWFLTSIKTANGEDVYLNYENVVDHTKSGSRNAYNVDQNGPLSTGIYSSGQSGSSTTINSKRLVSIETPYEKILLEANQQRLDYTPLNSLDDIKIITKVDNAVVKQFHFEYSYFQGHSGPVSNPAAFDNGYYYNTGDDSKRLKLNRLKLIDLNNSSNSPAYSFFYNESYPLPNRYSTEQDVWGYYNANGASHMWPRIFVNTSLTGRDRFSVFELTDINTPGVHVLQGQNRNSNPNTISLGTLEKIVYPTGGETQYEYEMHDFNYRGKYLTGGGIRVKKITDYDGLSHTNDVIKTYKYQKSTDNSTSGILFDLPQFAYLEKSCTREVGGSTFNPYTITSGSYDYYNYFTLRLDHSNASQGMGDQISVGYSEIKEETGSNGYTWFKYSYPGSMSDTNDNSGSGCTINDYGYCDGLFERAVVKHTVGYILTQVTPGVPNNPGSPPTISSVIQHSQGPELTNVDLSAGAFPYIPEPNYDWNRGLLMNKRIYNQNGLLLTTIDYTYALHTQPGGVGIVKGLWIRTGSNYNIQFPNYPAKSEMINYYGQYKILTNVSKMLVSEIRKDYFDEGQQIIETKHEYDYDGYKNLTENRITDSKGVINRTTYKYPYNFSYAPLVSRNIVTPVIERSNYKASLFLQSKTTNYRDWGNNIIEPETIVTNINGINETRIHYYSYDNRGNVLSMSNEYGPKTCYLWGYNSLYPIAEARNASLAEIYHQNFEDGSDLDGNTSRDNTRAHTGLYSGKIVNTGSGEVVSHSGTWLSIPFGEEGVSRRYLYSVWVYSTGPSADIFLFMKRPNETGYYSYVSAASTVQTGNWTLVQGIADVPYDVNQLNLRLDNNSNGTVWYDDLRLHPAEALMSTHTYKPLVGIGSTIDTKNETTYYEYDAFSRLKAIRDQYGNVVKSFTYNYKQ